MSSRQKPSNKTIDDVNILLLGPTGVGKTTFINAFANYLVYNTLDEAMEGPLQAIIPAWFTLLDKDTFEEKTIIIGKPDESEKKSKVGESCTRQCRSFVFRIGDRNLRLIDAPGIGDTQGVLQDEKNFEDILAYIAQYEYLNGICILLKPNEERLHILFRFCVKELLRHLHVHAKQNLMFVFTNTRSTHYEPGSTAPLLKELLRGLQDQSGAEIPFNRGNTFTFDNEAFRFLALCKNGIECNAREKQDYSRSWEYSIKEFTRLMQCIMRCDKHAVRDTLSLNEAQQLIRKLSRPIAEIATLIQENIQLAKKHKKDVVSHNTPTPKMLPQMDANTVPLGHPRTVCTNGKCIKNITVDGQPKVDYASHCHPHCLLVGIEQEVIGDEKLKECAAMHKQSCKFKQEKNRHLFSQRLF